MADEDSKIVIPIEITGDEEARQKIEQLSETVQRVLTKQASNAGITPEEFYRRGQDFVNGGGEKSEGGQEKETKPDKDPKTAPNLEQEVFNETNKEVGRTAEAVRLFREALHALHPALGEAGISLGEMTALVRASTGGVVALAAAVGGLLVTALEKAGDAANDASNRLGTFAPGGANAKEGRKEFGGLQETGHTLSEFPTSLAPAYEQLLRINQNQPPGQQQPNENLREILTNLTKGLQAERVDPEKGLAALTETLSDIREKGFITGDSLKALENIAPRLASTLLQELNKQKPGAATFSDRNFLDASRAAGGQIGLDLQKTQAEFPASISDAWRRVKVASEGLSEITTGGHVVASALDGFASFLEGVTSAAKKVQEKSPGLLSAVGSGLANTAALVGGPVVAAAKEVYNVGSQIRSKSNEGTADQQDRLNTSFDRTAPVASENAAGTASAADQLREAFLALHPAVEGAQKTLEDWADKQKELGAVSADAAKKQAAINLKFEPAETASGLAKDQVAVQNSDIHLKQALLNRAEASKQQELAGLAPESAAQNLRGAQHRYNDALEKFQHNRGVNTDALHQSNQFEGDSEALDEAALAVKRAKIEQKYSYLDEPKARLAAEQAETAIKSAEIEKNDSSLKLAKDQAGAPVSHELAQLRYAQASLDFDKVKVELLQKILGALNGNNKKADEDVKNLLDKNGYTPTEPSGRGERFSDTKDRNVHTVEGDEVERESGRDRNVHTVEGDHAIHVPDQDRTESKQNTSQPDARSAPSYQPPVQGRYDDNGQFVPGRQTSSAQQPPPPQPPQQVADLGSILRDLFTNITSIANGVKGPEDNTVRGPVDGLGVRGDNITGDESKEDVAGLGNAASGTKDDLNSLGDALSGLIGKIQAADIPGGDTVTAATGGHIRGPGTSTSDSINARLSDGEYVQTADATQHYGVAFMDAIRDKRLPKFAVGGMFNALRSGMASNAPSLGFAGGGMARAAPAAAASQMEHWGTIDMRTDHGDVRVATERDTMRHVSSSAQRAKRYSTGPKPTWYGGGQ